MGLICDRSRGIFSGGSVGKSVLPCVARLLRLFLPPSHYGLHASRDLKDYCFLLGTGPFRYPWQAWGPRVPRCWTDDIDDVSLAAAECPADWWEADLLAIRSGVPGPDPLDVGKFCRPSGIVILMGDLDTVTEGQEFHDNILDELCVFSGFQRLCNTCEWGRGNVDLGGAEQKSGGRVVALWGAAYIDDLIALVFRPVR